MTACVFLGPTLPVADAQKILDARYLPPVRQGDVYRAVRRFRPRMIGIVDGHFHQVPSVWHKEILFAMAEGVHVFGSASMGALRAAELHRFGMEGVGEVFEAYRHGRLEDDDEVAVVHGPEELGFVAASEAMVNIRRTLEAACDDGVVGRSTKAALTDIAKALFYPERSYAEMLKRAAAAGCPKDEIAAFESWHAAGRIDVKRDDALQMLHRMAAAVGDDPPPASVAYRLEPTTMWVTATEAIDRIDEMAECGDGDGIDTWLIDEIRLDDDAFADVWQAALLRVLARNDAEQRGLIVDGEDRRETLAAFRRERHLSRGADFRDWLAERGLDRETLDRLLEGERLLDEIARGLHDRTCGLAVDRLRLGGDHRRLTERARDKHRVLNAMQHDRELTDGTCAITWYFNERGGRAPPDYLDAHARRRGFRDADDFRRAVTREFLYSHRNDEPTTP